MASSLLVVNWDWSFTKLGDNKSITAGRRRNDIRVLVRINQSIASD